MPNIMFLFRMMLLSLDESEYPTSTNATDGPLNTRPLDSMFKSPHFELLESANPTRAPRPLIIYNLAFLKEEHVYF